MTVSTVTVTASNNLDIGGLNFSGFSAGASSITVAGTLVLKSTGALVGVPILVAGSTVSLCRSAAGRWCCLTGATVTCRSTVPADLHGCRRLVYRAEHHLTAGTLDTNSGGYRSLSHACGIQLGQ